MKTMMMLIVTQGHTTNDSTHDDGGPETVLDTVANIS